MNTKRNVNLRGDSRLKRMIAGITGSVLTTMMVTAIFAGMISKKIIPEEKLGYCTVAVLLISVIAGNKIGTSKCDNKTVTSVCLGTAYLAILLILTAIFFGAQYQGLGVTIIIVLVGCVLAAMTGKNGSKNQKFKKSKYKRC